MGGSLSKGSAGEKRPAPWKTLIGYAIAALCLLWVFHDVKVGELFHSAKYLNWWWVAVAVLFDIASYVSQGIRWRMLLHPLGRVPVVRATQAIYAGLFVNEILPMRPGELLRTYLVSRWISVRLTEVLPSVLVERFFDAVWLALAFGITVLRVPLPRYLVQAEEILGYGVLAATVAVVYLLLSYREVNRAAPANESRKGPLRGIIALIGKAADGIRDIGRSRYFYASYCVSLLLLIGQILSYWIVMRAYGLKLSFWQGAAIFLILHVGTAIPSAPSNAGTYQFFSVLGLTLFGIEKTVATGFSVVVFLILTIPLWLIGFLVFSRLGLTVRGVQADIAALGKTHR